MYCSSNKVLTCVRQPCKHIWRKGLLGLHLRKPIVQNSWFQFAQYISIDFIHHNVALLPLFFFSLKRSY